MNALVDWEGRTVPLHAYANLLDFFNAYLQPWYFVLKGARRFFLGKGHLWGICKFVLGLLKGHQGKDQGQRRQLPPLPPLNIRPAYMYCTSFYAVLKTFVLIPHPLTGNLDAPTPLQATWIPHPLTGNLDPPPPYRQPGSTTPLQATWIPHPLTGNLDPPPPYRQPGSPTPLQATWIPHPLTGNLDPPPPYRQPGSSTPLQATWIHPGVKVSAKRKIQRKFDFSILDQKCEKLWTHI